MEGEGRRVKDGGGRIEGKGRGLKNGGRMIEVMYKG